MSSKFEAYALEENWSGIEALLRVFIPLAIPGCDKYLALKVMCPQKEKFRLPSRTYTNQGKMPLFLIEGKRGRMKRTSPWESFEANGHHESPIDRLIDSVHNHWKKELEFWLESFDKIFPSCTLDDKIEIRTTESDRHRISISFITERKLSC